MYTARDRYLDDSTRYHLTLRLDTRTGEMHSLLSDAAIDVEGRLGDILVRALDDIAAVLAEHVPGGQPSPEAAHFGCGT
jgi:hypothetical protein